MKDTTISDSIFYVGADDTTLDLFESQYIVPEGVSYNSYVIMDDKITIMDTVDQRATEEWIANVKNVLKDKTPAYLVVSHMYIRQLQRNKSNKPAYEYHSHRKFHP